MTRSSRGRRPGARRGSRAGSAREGEAAPGPIPLLEGEEAAAWVAALGRRPASAALPDVAPILAWVRADGDAALAELGERYDGVRPAELRVPPDRCERALERLPAARRKALARAARNIERFHAAQRRREPPLEIEPDVRAWREFRPIDRVGLYAPGGRASYPSSLLMAAIPARIAGCRRVVACSPPGLDGRPAPSVLAAAALAGVDEVYAVGGAQAIAALAFGTETIDRVDKVFGPGGAWVNAAKLAVAAEVAIDLPAGPSEVVAWAGPETPPGWTAAELLAQAEHGSDSLCVGILPHRDVAAAVREELADRLDRLERPDPAAASLARSALLVAPEPEAALAWIETIAPEHLALLFEDARRLLSAIGSAGSVFLGPWSPVAAGDYAAGPNHVLPTGRRARARGGLSLDDFGRWVQVLEIGPEGLSRLAGTIATLAEWEGLPAHAASVEERLEGPAPAGDEPERAGEPNAPPAAGGRAYAAGARAAEGLLRPELAGLAPYVTARSLHRGGILLDANENPFGSPVPELGPDLHRYPDPETPGLRRRLAERLGVPADGLWIGNGSDEAIDLLLRAAAGPGRGCVLPSPTYGVYANRAAAWGVPVREVPLDDAFDLDPERTLRAAAGAGLVILCSPNNPTGNLLSEGRILGLASRLPCPLAVDEAYVEFADRPSLASRTGEYRNLLVLRTFSKAWGLAGARVGYLVGDPALVVLLRRAGLPYPLSALAARAAERALDRVDEVERRRDRIVAERGRLHAALEGMGLRVLPSAANFLLFFVERPGAIQRRLAEEQGIVVRDRSGLPRLEGALRVSVGTPEENDRFLAALRAVLDRDGGRGEGGRGGESAGRGGTVPRSLGRGR